MSLNLIKNFINESFFSPPRNCIKIFILNLFGFQVMRILIINFFFYLNKIIKKKNNISSQEKVLLEKINEDGYIIINNFFDPKIFKIICKCIKKLKKNNLFKEENYGNANVLIGPIENSKNYNNIFAKYIISAFNKSILPNVVGEIIMKNINIIPNPSYQEIFLDNNKIDADDLNTEFHPDRFYPCVKAFFYIEDVNLDNGAFVYIPKSHKLTMQRIKYEYLYSIFFSTTLFDKYLQFFNFEKKNNRLTLTDSKFQEIFGKFKICDGKSNTLIICNNMGFHKRGKILFPNLIRKSIRFNFYDLQISDIALKIKFLLKNSRFFNEKK